MKNFWDLNAWQEAHKLTLSVYEATKPFPREELFGLAQQLRRAVVSVESNIAEGHGRFNDTEYHHFCNMAKGSLAEVQCQLLVARDLGYLASDTWQQIHNQTLTVRQLLQGLMRHLRPT
jgi:four helix bundle protein